MGKLKRRMKAGHRMAVELSDTGEKMIIEIQEVGSRQCQVLLHLPDGVKVYPMPANDGRVKS